MDFSTRFGCDQILASLHVTNQSRSTLQRWEVWQIPSNCVRENETIEEAVIRRLDVLGLTAATIWAGEHTYVIYNRRFREMQLIGVYAAEVQQVDVQLEPEENSDYGWYTIGECLDRVHYRGLREGLRSVHDYVTGVQEPDRDLCLYRKIGLRGQHRLPVDVAEIRLMTQYGALRQTPT